MYKTLTVIEVAMNLKPGDIVWLENGMKVEIISKKGFTLYPKYKYLVATLEDNTPKLK
jgi:hypothetical protein